MCPLRASEKPEEAELRKKAEELSGLESILADEELHLASIKASVRDFERRYFLATGHFFARLDEIRAQIAERAARGSNDVWASQTAKDARAHAQSSAAAVEAAEAAPRSATLNTTRLKELYRALAKNIHPDLATDEVDRVRRARIMADVNAAYERGDETRLEEILAEIEMSPDSVTGDGVASGLVRVIRAIAQVKRRLDSIEREREEIQASDMYKLMILVQEADSKGIDHIRQICSALGREIAEAEAQLHSRP